MVSTKYPVLTLPEAPFVNGDIPVSPEICDSLRVPEIGWRGIVYICGTIRCKSNTEKDF